MFSNYIDICLYTILYTKLLILTSDFQCFMPRQVLIHERDCLDPLFSAEESKGILREAILFNMSGIVCAIDHCSHFKSFSLKYFYFEGKVASGKYS